MYRNLQLDNALAAFSGLLARYFVMGDRWLAGWGPQENFALLEV
jgi:hypothetical protein